MPSVKNPNGPSKNRLAARAAKSRKQALKNKDKAALKENRIAKADTKRGARPGLLPTSGPNAAISAKKRRKLERKLGHALKRKAEEEGQHEAEMKDAPEAEDETKRDERMIDEQMAVDMENI